MIKLLQGAAALILLATVNTQLVTAHAQGTAFTYQGRLNDGTNAANGIYDLRFALFDALPGGTGNQQGNLLTNSATAVTNGLFTVQLDFSNQFLGAPRWLEIGVRSNGVATFITLAPRQPLTPAPYAIYAESANASNLVGTVQSANLSAANIPGVALLAGGNAFTGNQTVSGSVGIGTSNPPYQVSVVGPGTTGTDGILMLQTTGGTAGPQLRLNKGGPGGDEWVFVADGIVNGPVGALQIVDSNSGSSRLAIATNGNVGIGTTSPANKLDVQGSADFTGNVGIGTPPSAYKLDLLYGGGGAGLHLATSGGYSALDIDAPAADTVLRFENSGAVKWQMGNIGISNSFSLYDATANVTRLLVQGGTGNVGIGTTTPSSALQVNGTATATTFAGSGTAVDFKVNGLRALRLESIDNGFGIQSINAIGGYSGNYIAGGVLGSVIAGGGDGLGNNTNTINDSFSMIGSGYGNSIGTSSAESFIGAGSGNSVSDGHSFIGAGSGNSVNSSSSVIVGGVNNTITVDANDSFLGGGQGNSIGTVATGTFGVLSGGQSNNVGNFWATVPGGFNNIASGKYSFAAGQQAQALNDGSFVWADDSSSSAFASTANNQFLVRAQGGVGIGTTTPAAGLDVEYSPAGVNHGTWGYLQQPGYNAGPLSGSPNLAIYTSGAIGAATYYAFSDARIKNVIGVSDNAKDLETLRGIQITDYTYKDKVAHGEGAAKKVIAQQVESVYPQAVSKTKGVIPDIYQPATIKDGWVQLDSDLKAGESVKLISDASQGIYQVLEVRKGEFRTDFPARADKVFVIGRQVDDFRNVDYEALTTLNISATQELARKLEAQQAVLTRLQDQLNQTLAEKEMLRKHLAALEARDQEREDRLARIESSLDKNATHAIYASVHQP